MNDVEMYGVEVGMLVHHVKVFHEAGVVVSIDRNLRDVTTCTVAWGYKSLNEVRASQGVCLDTVWTNKLVPAYPPVRHQVVLSSPSSAADLEVTPLYGLLSEY